MLKDFYEILEFLEVAEIRCLVMILYVVDRLETTQIYKNVSLR